MAPTITGIAKTTNPRPEGIIYCHRLPKTSQADQSQILNRLTATLEPVAYPADQGKVL